MRFNGIPELHVVSRTEIRPGAAILFRVLAVIIALLMGGLFIFALGHNPVDVYLTLMKGALGTPSALRETIKLAIPLLITSLGITLSFKMKFWNIGAEGQICMGATAAAYFALFHSDWPPVVLYLVMAAAAIIAGGLWGMIPAFFKARFGTNETLFTLMLNYIATYFIIYLRIGPWKNPTSPFPKIAMFPKSAQLPAVLGVHIGWIVALIMVVLVYVYMRHTKQGYELSVVGENYNTARYAGMNVRRIIARTVFISAGICGLAGMLQAAGADRTLTESVGGGVGFTAISVAWLSKLNPFVIVIVSALFACLTKGCGTISSIYNISTSAAEVFQGIILFCVLGSEFFISYKLVSGKRDAAGGERGVA